MLGLGVGAAAIMSLVLAAILAFEVWMFVSVLTNPRLSDTEKLLWRMAYL